MTTASVVRVVCTPLFLASAGLCVYLYLRNETKLARKLLWIAAVFLAILIRPDQLPFFSGSRPALFFFRNAFTLLSFVFLLVDTFVIFWIQLPQERLPRYSGVVTSSAASCPNTATSGNPQVEFFDSTGKRIIFVDKFACIFFPDRIFKTGEQVPVVVRNNNIAHIGESFLSRWDTAIFLLCLTGIVIGLSVTCQMLL